jgi:hypothetical protein
VNSETSCTLNLINILASSNTPGSPAIRLFLKGHNAIFPHSYPQPSGIMSNHKANPFRLFPPYCRIDSISAKKFGNDIPRSTGRTADFSEGGDGERS